MRVVTTKTLVGKYRVVKKVAVNRTFQDTKVQIEQVGWMKA